MSGRRISGGCGSCWKRCPRGSGRSLLLRYGLAGQPPLTQLETAQLLGISRSYVSRLESHALCQLRQYWDKKPAQE
ncbi:MAG: sigma factor-like helix-turn-helix DNA-binding protein [Faecalibacterium sp.]